MGMNKVRALKRLAMKKTNRHLATNGDQLRKENEAHTAHKTKFLTLNVFRTDEARYSLQKALFHKFIENF